MPEDLAHSRAHQVASLGAQVVVAPPDPGGFSWVDGFERVDWLFAIGPREVLVHVPILARRPRGVNRPMIPLSSNDPRR